MTLIYIGLGSNKGRRIKNIEEALGKLKKEIDIQKVSSFYLTEPVETKGGWFVNCVAEGQTNKLARELLTYLLQIEKEMGRVREREEGRRSIDLDILFYGEEIIQEKDLIIPHPHLHQRRFILTPLAEINPKLNHFLLNKTVDELLKELEDPYQVEKIKEIHAGS